MKARSIMVGGMLLTGLIGFAGSGAAFSSADLEGETLDLADEDGITAEDIGDLYTTLPPAVTDTIAAMGEEACAFGVNILATQGWDVPENRDRLGYEYDALSGSCKDFRDALTHRAWDGDKPPYMQYCSYINGVNCIAVGHYACDFALIVDSGLVYVCMNGITPYN